MQVDPGAGGASTLNPLRVAVTRPVQGSAELADLLRDGGAECITLPLTSIAPPLDDAPLEAALSRIQTFDWIVFTSANAVESVRRFAGDSGPPGTLRVAAVGEATAAAVRARLGWEVSAVPEVFAGGEIATAMKSVAALQDALVLWPRAERAREDLGRDLRQAGAAVTEVIAYRTRPESANASRLHRLVAEGKIDVLTFTAPSAVESYRAAGSASDGVLHAVLGSTTAAAVEAAGWSVDIQPRVHTVAALAGSILEHRRVE